MRHLRVSALLESIGTPQDAKGGIHDDIRAILREREASSANNGPIIEVLEALRDEVVLSEDIANILSFCSEGSVSESQWISRQCSLLVDAVSVLLQVQATVEVQCEASAYHARLCRCVCAQLQLVDPSSSSQKLIRALLHRGTSADFGRHMVEACASRDAAMALGRHVAHCVPHLTASWADAVLGVGMNSPECLENFLRAVIAHCETLPEKLIDGLLSVSRQIIRLTVARARECGVVSNIAERMLPRWAADHHGEEQASLTTVIMYCGMEGETELLLRGVSSRLSCHVESVRQEGMLVALRYAQHMATVVKGGDISLKFDESPTLLEDWEAVDGIKSAPVPSEASVESPFALAHHLAFAPHATTARVAWVVDAPTAPPERPSRRGRTFVSLRDALRVLTSGKLVGGDDSLDDAKAAMLQLPSLVENAPSEGGVVAVLPSIVAVALRADVPAAPAEAAALAAAREGTLHAAVVRATDAAAEVLARHVGGESLAIAEMLTIVHAVQRAIEDLAERPLEADERLRPPAGRKYPPIDSKSSQGSKMGSSGRSRRWGYAAHPRNDHVTSNVLSKHWRPLMMVLLSTCTPTGPHRMSAQRDAPYVPIAMLHAVVSLMDRVIFSVDDVCRAALPTVHTMAAQHPHWAVQAAAWDVLARMVSRMDSVAGTQVEELRRDATVAAVSKAAAVSRAGQCFVMALAQRRPPEMRVS